MVRKLLSSPFFASCVSYQHIWDYREIKNRSHVGGIIDNSVFAIIPYLLVHTQSSIDNMSVRPTSHVKAARTPPPPRRLVVINLSGVLPGIETFIFLFNKNAVRVVRERGSQAPETPPPNRQSGFPRALLIDE